jgi:hypothetical protein
MIALTRYVNLEDQKCQFAQQASQVKGRQWTRALKAQK